MGRSAVRAGEDGNLLITQFEILTVARLISQKDKRGQEGGKRFHSFYFLGPVIPGCGFSRPPPLSHIAGSPGDAVVTNVGRARDPVLHRQERIARRVRKPLWSA